VTAERIRDKIAAAKAAKLDVQRPEVAYQGSGAGRSFCSLDCR
jgi:hypothetical protein